MPWKTAHPARTPTAWRGSARMVRTATSGLDQSGETFDVAEVLEADVVRGRVATEGAAPEGQRRDQAGRDAEDAVRTRRVDEDPAGRHRRAEPLDPVGVGAVHDRGVAAAHERQQSA